MEYTGISISKEKEEFVPRKSKEEFFRDGKVIEQLFEMTAGWMPCKYDVNRSGYALRVFNHAYCICWMFIEGKGSVPHIANSVEFENHSVRNYAWAVAYALFQLHDKFYPLTKRTQMEITMLLPRDFYATRYEQFVKDKVLENPVDFRTPECMPEPETDMVQARDCVVAAFDKAIALEEENKRLREQLDYLLKGSALDKQLINELKGQNALLQQKVNKLENDELCKVVNLESIARYCLRQTHPKTIQVIVNMLNRLCVSKGCVPEPLRNRIEELEEHICVLESPQPSIQNNHGCQQFYGNVNDSEFPIQ